MLILRKELHRDVRYHPIVSGYKMNDLIVAVEAAEQGATAGEDTVSGLMLADDFIGISETPEGLQKQIEKALEYTRKWRVAANGNKCAAVVCNEDKVNPIKFRYKWGQDELPIVGQYTYLGVEISKHRSKILGCTYSKSNRIG